MITKLFDSKNVKYYVNEEKRTVTAVLDDESLDLALIDYIGKQWNASVIAPWLLTLPTHFSATARCNEADTFNVGLGKLIALTKLEAKIKLKCTKIFDNFYYQMWKYFDHMQNCETVLLDDTAHYIKNQWNYINGRLQEEHQ